MNGCTVKSSAHLATMHNVKKANAIAGALQFMLETLYPCQLTVYKEFATPLVWLPNNGSALEQILLRIFFFFCQEFGKKNCKALQAVLPVNIIVFEQARFRTRMEQIFFSRRTQPSLWKRKWPTFLQTTG